MTYTKLRDGLPATNDPDNNGWCIVCKAYTVAPKEYGAPCPQCDGANLDPGNIAWAMGYGRNLNQGD